MKKIKSKRDKKYMELAFQEAKKALEINEVPIGAIVVKDDEVIGSGYNLKESTQNPTAHAEMIAIRDAASSLNSWRLENCELFVTLEPCPMCIGAMLQARVKRLVFAAYDSKGGAVGSLYNLSNDKRFNHQIDVKGGLMEEKSSKLLKNFFEKLRSE
ncbi:MAG: tRNA adenosine(34) deaminase TadA [Candidatus Woesearchaeota archaeon]